MKLSVKHGFLILFATFLALRFMTLRECLKMLYNLLWTLCQCLKGLFQCLDKRSFINKSTEKRKSGRSNKQSNLSETASRCNSLEFNQADNSAKREFRKRETKYKNKRFAVSFVKMLLTVCVKDGSDYV